MGAFRAGRHPRTESLTPMSEFIVSDVRGPLWFSTEPGPWDGVVSVSVPHTRTAGPEPGQTPCPSRVTGSLP